jgi:hypothetical protein
MIQPLVIFAATRGVVFLTGYLANVALPSPIGDGYWHAMASNLFLDVWARQDSAFYLSIATQGYDRPVSGQLSNLAFFPVYPLLTKLLGGVVGNPVLAGVVVSHLTFLGALFVLDRLTILEFADSSTARRSVFYLAAFPGSVFFSAVYTESTFLLFAVATLYCARRQWWLAAGTLGALASATRIIGIVLWPVLVVEWVRCHGWSLTTVRNPAARLQLMKASLRDCGALLTVSLTPLGLASYAVFLGATFQDPIAFWTVQSLWGRDNRGPVAAVVNAISGFQTGDVWTGTNVYWNVPLDLVAFMMALVIGVAVFRRLGAGYGLYTILSVVIPAWSSIGSMIRFAVVLFPMFMVLGDWGRRPMVDRALSTAFLVLLGVTVAIYANWVFLG